RAEHVARQEMGKMVSDTIFPEGSLSRTWPPRGKMVSGTSFLTFRSSTSVDVYFGPCQQSRGRRRPYGRRGRDAARTALRQSSRGSISMGFLAGKRALIVGVASNRSIAWGIAKAMQREG